MMFSGELRNFSVRNKKATIMPRQSNTTTSGGSFDAATIEAVWNKAKEDPGFATFKKDSCGATIQRFDFGKTTGYGWEIDRTH